MVNHQDLMKQAEAIFIFFEREVEKYERDQGAQMLTDKPTREVCRKTLVAAGNYIARAIDDLTKIDEHEELQKKQHQEG